jgi:hypothetical protein
MGKDGLVGAEWGCFSSEVGMGSDTSLKLTLAPAEEELEEGRGMGRKARGDGEILGVAWLISPDALAVSNEAALSVSLRKATRHAKTTEDAWVCARRIISAVGWQGGAARRD